jgi:hypothetical protein
VLRSQCSGARPLSTFDFAPSQQVSKHPSIGASAYTSSIPTRPLRSSSSSVVVLALISILGGAILYTVSPSYNGRFTTEERQAEDPENSKYEFASQKTGEIIGIPNEMTGESLPGRPGTLTEHEQELLKEFWVATLHVFGVLDTKESNDEPTPGVARVDTKKNKKKSRLGIFKSSKSKGDGSDAASVASTPPKEDKYGQTQEFQAALASMSPETLRVTFWSMVKHDHPDALLLRFLRARKWDVERALVMMVSTMRWRATEMHVDDDIMKNGEMHSVEEEIKEEGDKKKDAHDFMEQMRLGKSFLHGVDKLGRPMCIVRARLHRQGELTEASLERYTVYLIESARMLLAPPVDTAVSHPLPAKFPG